jgi:hypothetical protein
VLASNFNDYLLTQEYFAFDIIAIKIVEFIKFRGILKKVLNYDGVVIITDTGEVLSYDTI